MDKEMDNAIQRMVYSNNSDIPSDHHIMRYQFVMMNNFTETDSKNSALEITSFDKMEKIFHNKEIEHQVFLRGDIRDDQLLTDDWECLIFQVRF